MECDTRSIFKETIYSTPSPCAGCDTRSIFMSCIYPTPLPSAECDTRSIFKGSMYLLDPLHHEEDMTQGCLCVHPYLSCLDALCSLLFKIALSAPCVTSLKFKWCNHPVVLTWLGLKEFPHYFIREIRFSFGQ